jgi:hypothetical protein
MCVCFQWRYTRKWRWSSIHCYPQH